MSIESAVEQGLKTAFKAYTDTLDPADAVTYRCFFLDDESDSALPTEQRKYPYIEITASPNWPTSHKFAFRDIPVSVTWATQRQMDPKKSTLVSLYENCRSIIDTESTIAVSGYSLIAVRIEAGGESDIEENQQHIMLPLTVKICGA
ncbi:MAG: hypothetical protein ABIH03_09355 [Pseudomonadota bacterium]